MVVTENEQLTLCSFIQWFLAKVSNFMAPSGMFFSWFCFFSRAQFFPELVYFYLGFNYSFLFYCEGLALFYESKGVKVFW